MGRVVRRKKKRMLMLLMLLIAVAGFTAYKTGFFEVRKVTYTPNMNLSDVEVMERAGLNEENNWFLISEKKVAEGVESHPYVKSVAVEKTFPNHLKLDIKYREEYAALVYAGLYITIDDEMVALSLEDGVGDLFVIEGFAFDSFKIGEEVKVVQRHQLVRTIQLISLLNQSHIEAKPHIRYDGGIELLINDAYKANFGDGKDMESKFNGFVSIYEVLSKSNVQSGVIDVSHGGLPSYRPFGN